MPVRIPALVFGLLVWTTLGYAAQDAPVVDRVAERWPVVLEIEGLLAADDDEGARAALASWVEPGLDELVGGLDHELHRDLLTRVEHLARAAADTGLRLAAGEAFHAFVSEAFGADDPRVLEERMRLARTRAAAGDVEGRLELEEAVLAVRQRDLEPDDPVLLETQLEVGTTYYELGRYERARELLVHVHAARVRLLAPTDPALLEAKGRLSALHDALEEFPETLQLELAIHAVRSAELAADDPWILAQERDLAWLSYEVGDTEAALVWRSRVHATLSAVRPKGDADLLEAEARLAEARRDVGDVRGALVLEERIFTVRTNGLEVDAPAYLAAAEALAMARTAASELAGALELYAHVHERTAARLIGDDPELVRVMANHALALRRSGALAEAIALLERVVAAIDRRGEFDDVDGYERRAELAAALAENGDRLAAHAVHERAHRLAHEFLVSDRAARYAVIDRLASSFVAVGQPLEGVELRRAACRELEADLPDSGSQLAFELRDLGRALADLGDVEGTRETFERLVELQTAQLGNAHERTIRTRLEAARQLLAAGDVPSSLAAVRAVCEALENTPDGELVFLARQDLANGYLRAGLPAEAETVAADLLERQRRSVAANDVELAFTYQILGTARLKLGDVDGAVPLFESAVAIHESSPRSTALERLDAKGVLAAAYLNSGRIEESLELHLAVRAAIAALPETTPVDLLLIDGNIAACRHMLGDLLGSLALRERSLDVARAHLPPGHPEVIKAMHGLFGALNGFRDFDRMLALQREIVARTEQLHPADNPLVLQSHALLGLALSQAGEDESGRALMEEVLVKMQQVLAPTDIEYLRTKSNLALLRRRTGDVEGCLELLRELDAIFRTIYPPAHESAVHVRQNLADALAELGDVESAIRFLEENLSALRDAYGTDHPSVLSSNQLLLTLSFRARSDEEFARVCLDVLDGVDTVTRGLVGSAPRLARTRLLGELRAIEDVLSLNRVLPSEQRDAVDTRAFEVLELVRSASSASPQVARAAKSSPEVAALAEQVASVRRRLADSSQAPPGSTEAIEAWRAELVRLAGERDRLTTALLVELDALGLRVEVPTAAIVADALAEGAALATFFRYWPSIDLDERPGPGIDRGDSTVAFVLARNGRVRRVELGPTQELEDLVVRWRALLGTPIERGLAHDGGGADLEREVGSALRRRLVDPCLAVLGDDAPAALHVVLDGFLHLLPIDALPAESGEPLGATLRINVETSVGRLLGSADALPPGGTLVALGGVDFSAPVAAPVDAGLSVPLAAAERGGAPANFASLLQSRFEVEATCALFEELTGGEPELRTRARATKAELARLAPQTRYLHVATHGWFAPESPASSLLDGSGDADETLQFAVDRASQAVVRYLPETLCGLALAGANNGADDTGRVPGILTAEELSTLDLAGCELAVLSACETNVGIRRAGQGIQSLQTALHAAGVRTAITSLWKVDDAATRRLFEIFYTRLWQEGLGKADALWQAKMALRAEGYPVRDWAAWVLTGNPD